MSFSSFVALRYLSSGRRDRFFSWIALLSICGVAIGVATMIVVLSVINGFESELQNRFLNANSHILFFRYPDGLQHPEEWRQKVARDFPKEVIGSSPFVHYETMMRHGGLLHSVLVRGFNPAVREKVQSLRNWVHPQNALEILSKESESSKTPDVPSIIVGEGILQILGVKIGDQVQMISPSGKDFRGLKSFRIVGTYHSGLKHYDNRLVATALNVAQEFFAMGDRVTGLEIGLVDPQESSAISVRMIEKYPVSVKEWQSFNRPLLEALKMERAVIFFVVCLVAVVAGFNILTTLFVAVTQKQKQISLLKSLGATNPQLTALFLKQGLLFGLVGSAIGMLLALGISWLISTYQFIDLPDPYYLTNLPVEYDWRVYSILAGFGTLICVIAGIIPAWTAMRITPTDGLKGNAKGF